MLSRNVEALGNELVADALGCHPSRFVFVVLCDVEEKDNGKQEDDQKDCESRGHVVVCGGVVVPRRVVLCTPAH